MIPPPSPWKLTNWNVPVKTPVTLSPEMVYRASPPCPSGMTPLSVNGARRDGPSAAAGGRTAFMAAFETVWTRARAVGLAAGCRTASPPAGASRTIAFAPRSPPWNAARAISSALLSVITAAVVIPVYGVETLELPPPPPHEESDSATRTSRTVTIRAPRFIRQVPLFFPGRQTGTKVAFILCISPSSLPFFSRFRNSSRFTVGDTRSTPFQYRAGPGAGGRHGVFP